MAQINFIWVRGYVRVIARTRCVRLNYISGNNSVAMPRILKVHTCGTNLWPTQVHQLLIQLLSSDSDVASEVQQIGTDGSPDNEVLLLFFVWTS